ncbi:Sad1-interacting factor 2 [Uncinocarpus reesii 1704]|uniref:Sad1-interacting factor 2 n=1 Tax=Uncinocarpus reesii (strain UAMH 1704) TaxID=336963 RepID=C4JXE6_UNCRE|nr:Sad1-interacting factor 2 [Uncinocarpus reesii 1704]EEP81454.1 Sad1-interacting factor 2 [Uncinocarpus reesii 1704]
MTSIPSETSPLLQHGHPGFQHTSENELRPSKTVTFGPTPRSSPSTSNSTRANILRPLHSATPSIQSSSGQPVLAALNSKLRRRHSQGPSSSLTLNPAPKIGPQRTTKTTQKLKLLPNPVTGEEDEGIDDAVPRDVYSQIKRIKEPTARRDAARLGKADRDRLPRVTAYCTANSYRLESVMKFLKSRASTRGTNPKLFDECVYSPFNYDHEAKMKYIQDQSSMQEPIQQLPLLSDPTQRRFSDSELEVEGHREEQREQLLSMEHNDTNGRLSPPRLSEEHHAQSSPQLLVATSSDHEPPDLNTTIRSPEVFLFDYGTVVIWGMTPSQETRFLNEVAKFAESVLSAEDTQVENFNFYYTRDYQARIYNDFISLRDSRSYMTKLAISHALSQSVKTSLFEDLVSETIAATSPLPAQIAQTGSVNLTRRQINMQIGELFILRINIHLQGSVLDSPELMWAEPQLDPIYQAVRSYLEMDPRVELLTERLDVIADLLAVLKDQLSHRHGEYLEWIVIVLIAAEIVIAGINIVVDLYAGID